MTKVRASVIINWGICDDAALPDVPPGEEYERVITAQRCVVLCRILVRDLHLVHLQVGVVELAFELYNDSGHLRTYRPARYGHLRVWPRDEVSLLVGLDVRVVFRNGGVAPVKPRAALLVREELDGGV
jgi:hypothetical protein